MNRQQIAKNWVQPVTHPFGWPYCDHHGKTGPRDIYFLPTFHLITLFDKHKFSSYFLWYLFWQYLCSTNRTGKSGLPLLIQYLCWKNGNGISSSFFDTCARQTEEALSAAVTGSRPIISFTRRERETSLAQSFYTSNTYILFLISFSSSIQSCKQSIQFFSFNKFQPTQYFWILYYPAFVSERIISFGFFILQLTSRPTHWIWFLYGFVSSWFPKAR